MAGPFDFTGQNIEDSYQRVLQTDGTSIYDGTGSLFSLPSVFPYTGSARITGSLDIIGNQTLTGSVFISSSNFLRFDHTGSGTNTNYSDLSIIRYPTYDTPALRVVRPNGIGFTLYRQGSANNFWVGDEAGNRNMTLYSLAMGAFTFTAPGQGGDFSFTGGSAVDPTYASSIVFRTFDYTTNAVTSSDHSVKIQGPNVTGSTLYNLVSFQAGSTFAEKAAIRYDGGAYFSSSVSIATGSTNAMLFVKNPFDATGGTATAIFEHRFGVNALSQTQRYGAIVRAAPGDGTTAFGVSNQSYNSMLQGYDYVSGVYKGISLNPLGGSVSVGRNLLGTPDDIAKFVVRGRGATNATTTMRVENTNASASLVVLDNGNVGIGTSSPSIALHVDTTLSSPSTRISDFFYDYFIGYGSVGATKNNNYFQLYRNASQTYYDQSSGGHYFRSGVSDLLRILSNGNTLIGTTTDAGFKLDVSGSGRFTNNLTVTGSLRASSMTGSLQGTSSYALTASYVASASPTTLTFGGNLTQIFAEDGWVGIGTSSLLSTSIINSTRNYWLDLSIITSGYATGFNILLQLYASGNGVTNDTLIGTYNITSSAAITKYNLERTFFSYALTDSESGTTSYFLRGLPPSTNLNSDRLISSYEGETYIGYFDNNTNQPVISYPYLKLQVSCSSNYSCALGPSRITYQ